MAFPISNEMEGLDEDFSKFFNYILIFGIVFLMWSALKNDMTKRGVFGKVEQQKTVVNNSINFQSQNNLFNNSAAVRTAW